MPYKFISFIMVMFVLLSGCEGVVTNQPLSDPMTAEPDKSLYGHWINKHKTNKSSASLDLEDHLFIAESKKMAGSISKPFMEWLLIRWDTYAGSKKMYVFSGYGTVSQIGNFSYINLYHLATEGEEEDKIKLNSISDDWQYEEWLKHPKRVVGIGMYSVKGTKVTFWDVDRKVEEKLIEMGDLKTDDSILRKFKGFDVITFDSLFGYLRKHGGANLFKESREFTKVP